jgi:hypothetical protein
VFLAVTISVHTLAVYWLFTLALGTKMLPRTEIRAICVIAMVVLLAVFYWHYVWKENGARIIRSFEKRGSHAKYAWLGAFMFVETALLPLTLALLLVLARRLTGWPA